ncbi:MAG TPA: CDP-alcohol phosphatidyltransferase family protein [Chthoniobacterales bacterium]|nr:CDP-alcohol phosphatidyltransferase family protein [Chthoniobacterales bacterium]
MNAEPHTLRRVLVLADESADWMIAGLRQLDRLALSLNEFAVQGKMTAPLVVCVLWSPALDQSQRWFPTHARLAMVAFTNDVGLEPFDLVLSTRLFLWRNALEPFLAVAPAPPEMVASHGEKERWESCALSLESFPPSLEGKWNYIRDGEEIEEIEKLFLRGSGKSQDGFVSRYLNRPISRVVTRLLLRFPTTPNAWTLFICPIPVVASLIFLQGTYWAFFWGLVLYQLFSVLDGCDGEIARAKFLESERGRRLDDLCDVGSNILLVLGLGFGLSNFHGHAWFYTVEGILAALLIGANEFLLARRKPDENAPVSLGGTLYPRHRELIERSGILRLGEKSAYWLVQLTKRDVAVLGFVFLAAIGLPSLILHLLFAVAAISLALAVKSFFPGRAQ